MKQQIKKIDLLIHYNPPINLTGTYLSMEEFYSAFEELITIGKVNDFVELIKKKDATDFDLLMRQFVVAQLHQLFDQQFTNICDETGFDDIFEDDTLTTDQKIRRFAENLYEYVTESTCKVTVCEEVSEILQMIDTTNITCAGDFYTEILNYYTSVIINLLKPFFQLEKMDDVDNAVNKLVQNIGIFCDFKKGIWYDNSDNNQIENERVLLRKKRVTRDNSANGPVMIKKARAD
jgi:hypothetical protein